MAEQPDNLVLELLRGLRTEMGGLKSDVQSVKDGLKATREEMATKADLKADLNSLRADVASDLLKYAKGNSRTNCRRSPRVDRISLFRRRARMLIGELQDRVRRLEQHLNLPPLSAH